MRRHPPAWYDEQYNNRARVADSAAILQHWADASARARERLGSSLDVAYGTDASERLDIFPARQPGAPALYFDLAELSGYRYYTGIVFSAFVPGHGRAIARGGRYDGIGRAFGRERAATGFGADLRQWLSLSASAATPLTGILAPDIDDDTLWVEIMRLRAEGQRVVRRLSADKSPAAEFGCDRELVKRDGKWKIEVLK